MNLVTEGRHTARSLVWVENNELSPREMEVLQLMAQGHENKAIGEQLIIHWRTAHGHCWNIIKKLGARNRTHAVHIAYQRGYLHPHVPQTARQAIALAAYYTNLACDLMQREEQE